MEQTRRVVVTGLGVISPVGNTVDECWNNLKNGVHGIGPITLFDTTDYKTKIAAEVKNFDPRAYMDKTEVLRSDAFAQYGVAAAAQAVEENQRLSLPLRPVFQPDAMTEKGPGHAMALLRNATDFPICSTDRP